jgi:hypothetical protein
MKSQKLGSGLGLRLGSGIWLGLVLGLGLKLELGTNSIMLKHLRRHVLTVCQSN